MKNLLDYIFEKILINKDTNVKDTFTDEELREDYKAVKHCFSKSDKLPYMKKYDVQQNKIDVICQKILELLRDNRHKKKEFDINDAIYFYYMDIPDTPYKKSVEFFDKEPIEFIEYLKSYFENESANFKRARQAFRRVGRLSGISAADRHQLNMYDNVVKYLEESVF